MSLDERVAELASRYRPLAVEILREAVRIPADQVESFKDEIVARLEAIADLGAGEVDAGQLDAVVVPGGWNEVVGTRWAFVFDDGIVDFDDIDPFVLALFGETAYLAVFPDCVWLHADCNDDGVVNFDDIDPFVAALGL